MNVVVYHFWSPTCAPCRTIKPAVEDLREEFSQYQWISVNTHADQAGHARKFGVTVVPTMVVVKNGIEIGRHSGSSMNVYYSIMRKALTLQVPQ